MPRPSIRGVEKLTAAERLVGLTRLPYSLGCLVISLLIGSPGYFLLWYLDGQNLERAFRLTISNSVFSIAEYGKATPVLQGVVETSLFTFIMFFTLYGTRRIRLRVLEARPILSKLLVDGEHGFDRAFANISNSVGLFVFTAFFLIFYLPSRLLGATGFFSFYGSIVLVPIDTFAIWSLLWVYVNSLWGVHKFGREEMRLKHFYEDRMLGLRPLGLLSLSFVPMILAFDIPALAGSLLTSDIMNLIIIVSVLLMTIIMLFLPLRNTHARMSEEKQKEETFIRSRLRELIVVGEGLEKVQDSKALSRIEEILKIQTIREEVAKIPTWPFETRVVERVVAVSITATAIVLARLVQLAFHF